MWWGFGGKGFSLPGYGRNVVCHIARMRHGTARQTHTHTHCGFKVF